MGFEIANLVLSAFSAVCLAGCMFWGGVADALSGLQPLLLKIRRRLLACRFLISYRILPRQSFSLSISVLTDGP